MDFGGSVFFGWVFLILFPDFFYPEIPWETSVEYNYNHLISPEEDFHQKINIISFFEGVKGDEVYGVQPTLFNRNLIFALEDSRQIKRFLGILRDAGQGLKGTNHCFIKNRQKEIHVVTFDFSSNKAGYFVMHFCKVNGQVISMLKYHDSNWTSYITESSEMTKFLHELGIELQ